jgi:hypothetical protein
MYCPWRSGRQSPNGVFVMTTISKTAEDRLAEFGIRLPDAPTPFGAYVPAVQTGNLLFLSGMLATSGHTATVVGVVGKDLDVKAARAAAHTAADEIADLVRGFILNKKVGRSILPDIRLMSPR